MCAALAPIRRDAPRKHPEQRRLPSTVWAGGEKALAAEHVEAGNGIEAIINLRAFDTHEQRAGAAAKLGECEALWWLGHGDRVRFEGVLTAVHSLSDAARAARPLVLTGSFVRAPTGSESILCRAQIIMQFLALGLLAFVLLLPSGKLACSPFAIRLVPAVHSRCTVCYEIEVNDCRRYIGKQSTVVTVCSRLLNKVGVLPFGQARFHRARAAVHGGHWRWTLYLNLTAPERSVHFTAFKRW